MPKKKTFHPPSSDKRETKKETRVDHTASAKISATSDKPIQKRKLIHIDKATDPETDAQEQRTKRKYKSKRNPDNAGFNPKKAGKKKNRLKNFYKGREHNIRANANKTVTINNQEEKIRTTILIDAKTLQKNCKFMDPDALKKYLNKAFGQKLEENEHFRTIDKVFEYSVTGTPIKVKFKTPTKKTTDQNDDQDTSQHNSIDPLIGYRVNKIGPFSFYSNVPSETPLDKLVIVTDIDKNSDFFDSVSYHAIKEFKETCKDQILNISKKSIEEVEKKESRNQNKKMVKKGVSDKLGSATEYARSSELFIKDVKWEWLHLICYEVYGEQGQKSKNLVGGTEESNTEMVTVESQLHKIIKKYPEGFTLKVRGNVVPGTQLGTTIEYSIVTPDFTLPLNFNAQTTNKIHGSFHHFYARFIDSFLEAVDISKEQQQQIKASKLASPDVNFAENKFLLFSKPSPDSRQPSSTASNAPNANDTNVESNDDQLEISKARKKLNFGFDDNS